MTTLDDIQRLIIGLSNGESGFSFVKKEQKGETWYSVTLLILEEEPELKLGYQLEVLGALKGNITLQSTKIFRTILEISSYLLTQGVDHEKCRTQH